MGTKNNPKNRSKAQEKKQHNGKELEPVFYCGTHIGNGKYMAGKYSGSNTLACDENNKPIPWDNI